MHFQVGQLKTPDVIADLFKVDGTDAKVTVEIEGNILGGAPEHVARVVAENSRRLRFEEHGGFEEERRV